MQQKWSGVEPLLGKFSHGSEAQSVNQINCCENVECKYCGVWVQVLFHGISVVAPQI